MPTVIDDRSPAARPAEDAVLVRVEATDEDWARGLPAVPAGARVGVTVGDAQLRASAGELDVRGYALIDVVPGRRPGRHADLLVPAALRTAHPHWFSALLLSTTRVFDLRYGPVHMALRDELAAHQYAVDGRSPAS